MGLSARWRYAALAAVATLGLSGCGAAGASGYTLGAPAGSSDEAPLPGCDSEDIDDCLEEPADMQLLFDHTQEKVQEFAAEEVPQYPSETTWKYVGAGETGDEACVDYNGDAAQYSDQSYEYCPGDDTIYVGEALMWQFAQDNGSAGPSIGIAHEWGHSLQHAAGVDSAVTSREQYIQFENQADCIAGAWFRSQIRDGLASRSDVVDVATMMAAVSEAENPERTHGTLAEREKSFFFGVAQGLEYCSTSYFEETPIVPTEE